MSQNLLAYIGVLNDCGYNILLVNNGPLSARHIELFQSRCHTMVAKYYGGRDFGCFQYGTKLLQELAASRPILQVIYCNESVFVRPSQLSKTVERIRQSRAPLIGLTGSWESAYHVSSWLFAISGELFRDPAFQQFWADYLPTSSRTHTIWYGEIGLSAHLQRQTWSSRQVRPPPCAADQDHAKLQDPPNGSDHAKRKDPCARPSALVRERSRSPPPAVAKPPQA